MMRGVSTWAVGVRTPDGEVDVQSFPLVSWTRRHRVFRLPVIRGVVALVQSLNIGFKALGMSANSQLEERGKLEMHGWFYRFETGETYELDGASRQFVSVDQKFENEIPMVFSLLIPVMLAVLLSRE